MAMGRRRYAGKSQFFPISRLRTGRAGVFWLGAHEPGAAFPRFMRVIYTHYIDIKTYPLAQRLAQGQCYLSRLAFRDGIRNIHLKFWNFIVVLGENGHRRHSIVAAALRRVRYAPAFVVAVVVLRGRYPDGFPLLIVGGRKGQRVLVAVCLEVGIYYDGRICRDRYGNVAGGLLRKTHRPGSAFPFFYRTLGIPNHDVSISAFSTGFRGFGPARRRVVQRAARRIRRRRRNLPVRRRGEGGAQREGERGDNPKSRFR